MIQLLVNRGIHLCGHQQSTGNVTLSSRSSPRSTARGSSVHLCFSDVEPTVSKHSMSWTVDGRPRPHLSHDLPYLRDPFT